jgi:hypothetical protein
MGASRVRAVTAIRRMGLWHHQANEAGRESGQAAW